MFGLERQVRSYFVHTVEPAKSNHPGEIPKVVALRRWLLFAGSVVGQKIYVDGSLINIYINNMI